MHKRKVMSKSGINILEYEKSITIGGQVVFNGQPFSNDNIKVIKTALDVAFENGRYSKINEIKEVLEIK